MAARAVRAAAEISPELDLVVVSALRPEQGRWIEYCPGESVAANWRRIRSTLGGQTVALSVITLERRQPHRRLQAIALLTHSALRLGLNENLDYFEIAPENARTIVRHAGWRCREWWAEQCRRAVPSAAGLRARAVGVALAYTKREGRATGRPAVVSSEPRPEGISVVIPSRNGREMLERMLPAVLDQVKIGETIVVNNGSDDGTAEMLAERFPHVKAMDYREPLFFPVAINAGLRAARYSHVCLLNNDMAIAPGFLQRLREAFDRVPDLFCAAAQVFLLPGVPRQETGKAFLLEAPAISDFPVFCGLPMEGEDLTYVLYGSSGCSLYDARKLAELNGLDEVFAPAYVEDLDVGVRAWQFGWPIVFVAGAHVVHEHRATMGRLYSKARLDAMVASHWLLFLARTIQDRSIFRRYWRHAVARLERERGNEEARGALAGTGFGGSWTTRRIGAALCDAEILALCNGSVAVFPGGAAGTRECMVVSVRAGWPEQTEQANEVIVALVDQPGPPPAALLEQCVEIVTVSRTGGEKSFRAAVNQTVRKWEPIEIRIDTAVRAHMPGCFDARYDGLRDQQVLP